MPTQRLAVFYNDPDKQLRWKIKEGDRWIDGQFLKDVNCWRRPSAVNFGGATYVFFQSAIADPAGNIGIRYIVIRDGRWDHELYGVFGAGMTAGPSAIVYQDKLWVFHTAGGGDGLWYTVFDGNQWTPDQIIPNTALQDGPSALVWSNRLHVFHRGGNKTVEKRIDPSLWFSAWDGQSWQADSCVGNVKMSQSPGAVVYRDRIWVFHQDSNETSNLYYVHYTRGDSSWSAETHIEHVGISDSPSPLVVGDELFVFHQGADHNGELWCLDVNRLSDVRIPDVKMLHGPCPILLPG